MTQWKTGILECFSDVPLCLFGACCSCVLFGQNAEQITGEPFVKSCILFAITGCCHSCIVHKPQRQKLRSVYGLEEKPSDFLATCICTGCANCQEARELKIRGVKKGERITSQPR